MEWNIWNIGQQTPRHTNAPHCGLRRRAKNNLCPPGVSTICSSPSRHFSVKKLISKSFVSISARKSMNFSGLRMLCKFFVKTCKSMNSRHCSMSFVGWSGGFASLSSTFCGQVFVSAVPTPSLPQMRSWHHVHPGSPNPPSTKLPHNHHRHKPVAPTFHPHGRWSWKLCSWWSHLSEQNQPVQPIVSVCLQFCIASFQVLIGFLTPAIVHYYSQNAFLHWFAMICFVKKFWRFPELFPTHLR